MSNQIDPSATSSPGGCAATPVRLPPILPPEPCCCDSDPITGLKQLFVDYFQGRGMAAGRDPATRPVFLRLHGVAHGRFIVDPDLPPELRVGVFAQAPEYPAWVRFSADVQPGVPDLKGTTGIGIKLFGVEGEKLLVPDQDATTQDFILQNHDVFFVDTAKDMCEFTCASLHGKGDRYLAEHPVTARVLDAMKKVVDSALTTPYWSVLPYGFGQGRYVKYKLEPLEAAPADGPPDFDDPFYLRADLHARLRKGPARFSFLVQFRTDDAAMPLDAATVRWSEDASPPIQVGILELPQQDLDTRGQATYGEHLAWNPWHALPEHRPAGSISDAREVVYRASSENRRNVNGVPLAEPVVPRPPQYAPGVDYPKARDTRIVRAAIHPAIGIARVGDSECGFYLGPQVVDPLPQPAGHYRDDSGALKREAAQFRLYGYNAAGEVVRELTPDTALIRWSVHVANRKAAWYQWQIAMDIPEAAENVLPLRNAEVRDRASLVIDGGLQHVAGRNASPVAFNGRFGQTPVYLGECWTDAAGRLMVLGGHGISASPTDSPIYNDKDPFGFINADGWYDDVSDGPIDATVSIEGREIPVDGAWVVTAPPNYAPQLKSVRTLYDLLYDLNVQAGWMTPPSTVSFTRDVYPILQRLTGLQWVNQGYSVQFGHQGPYDFNDPALIARLATKPAPKAYDINAELRLQIFHNFRPPVPVDGNQLPWPWLFGDAMELPAINNPRQNATITAIQSKILQRWAAGDFDADWGRPGSEPVRDIDDLPAALQPTMLDRAALDFCLADAFHPGCEMTWPMRHQTMYSGPFRIRHRPEGEPEPNYGKTLDQATILSAIGPLRAQGPGDITRWMGLPWQADTAFCRGGYFSQSKYDPFVPTFWPARVPNQVLSEEDYEIVRDDSQPMDARVLAFRKRFDWNAPLGRVGVPEQMRAMVDIFGSMGVVEVRPGVTCEPAFPKTMMVASFGPKAATTPALKRMAATVEAAIAEEGAETAGGTAGEMTGEVLLPLPVRRNRKRD